MPCKGGRLDVYPNNRSLSLFLWLYFCFNLKSGYLGVVVSILARKDRNIGSIPVNKLRFQIYGGVNLASGSSSVGTCSSATHDLKG